MTRYLLPILAMAAVFFAAPLSACEITCPDGSHCSSARGDCHCDDVDIETLVKAEAGQAHCVDAKRVTTGTVEYLRSWNLPRFQRLADLASKILEAQDANDLAGYQRASHEYQKALTKLTGVEREVAIAGPEMN